MPKTPRTLRQRLAELKTDNDELQAIVDDYEERFAAISEQVPEDESDADAGDED